MSSDRPFPTIVHPFSSFPSPTSHACAYEVGLPSAHNALVFIGGLGDGPHTVPYPRAIAKGLEQHADLDYSVFEFRMTSSFNGFGFSRLANDVADISALVKYLRGIGKKRIVLMGHSTGTQDCMEYASPSYANASVNGFILQAPVSDRGAIKMIWTEEELEKSLELAKSMVAAGKGHERMPREQLPSAYYDTPMSAFRYYALCAVDGEDNYFDPDLPDNVIEPYWKRFDKPLLILQSGEDEYVPASVDKAALVQHWKSLCKPGIASDLSGPIPGANHRVEEPESEAWLTDTVIKFLKSIQ
ncbi:dolichol-phosphate mannosyltransferase [Pseudomassariella vexata]|uniref:Dolichol-phosphate mannosyltransferase n=1 Tax=Pseudomassariella vexata TaxID=1141098 RepID=A0A1Y2EEI2_9PEZI|nr:dolichol-phosphate mannosyltransferase [Pseudomassariella vexata]ORY69982.1 dolichol-phosphate mannosyltransferase [Pseudomassariella vexata]